MSKQSIWNYLKSHTELSDEAIAGVMGNMEAESNCESCRLQGDFTSDRRTSKQYAQQVNSGALPNWYTDSKGWGLCQWTYYTRKQNLRYACQSYGVGIENEGAQLAFFLSEFQNEYPNAWRMLLNTNDIYDAARIMCVEYERPAINNVAARAEYGKEIYKQFHGKQIQEPEPAPSTSPAPSDDVGKQIIYHLEQILLLLKGGK